VQWHWMCTTTNRANVLGGSYAVTSIRQWRLNTGLFLHAGRVGEEWCEQILCQLCPHLRRQLISASAASSACSGHKLTTGQSMMTRELKH